MKALARALLENVIDYAGLFPPASLGLAEAAANYGRYLAGEHGWMLGRFIVPSGRLRELETYLASKAAAGWRVSALVGTDTMTAVSEILAFNAHARGASVDSMETRAESAETVRLTADAMPGGLAVYFEVPGGADPGPLVEAIAAVHGRAKIRTGGVKPESFPSADQVARFIERCCAAGVPFKATAGLHHAVRGEYAIDGAGNAQMHGFLNMIVAAAAGSRGASVDEIAKLLAQTEPSVDVSERGLMNSFGSCSFEEPVSELKARGLL